MLREDAINQYGVYYKIPNVGVSSCLSIMAQECLGNISHHQKVNSNSLVFSSKEELEKYMHHACNVNALRELTKAVRETSQNGLSKALSFIKQVGSDDEKWLKFKKAQSLLERVDNVLSSTSVDSPEGRLSALENEKRYLDWIYNRESITQTISEMCDYYKIKFSHPAEKSKVTLNVSELPDEVNVADKMAISEVFLMSASSSIVDGEEPKIHRINIEFDHVARADGRVLLNSREQEEYASYYKCVVPDENNRFSKELSLSVIGNGADNGLKVNSNLWLAFPDKESLVKHVEGIRSRVNCVCDNLLNDLSDISDMGSNILPINKHNID